MDDTNINRILFQDQPDPPDPPGSSDQSSTTTATTVVRSPQAGTSRAERQNPFGFVNFISKKQFKEHCEVDRIKPLIINLTSPQDYPTCIGKHVPKVDVPWKVLCKRHVTDDDVAQAIPSEQRLFWNGRLTFDHIIILDDNSRAHNFGGSPAHMMHQFLTTRTTGTKASNSKLLVVSGGCTEIMFSGRRRVHFKHSFIH